MKLNPMTTILMSAAAGIAGTGIATTAKPDTALAKKPEDANLNSATTAKVVGDGLDSGASAVQMDQTAKGVTQTGDGAGDGNIELNQSSQADAKVTGADQAT